MKRIALLAVAGLALAASAAWSQQAAPEPGAGAGPGQRRGGAQGPGQRGMRGGMMGDVRQAVTLTPEQEQQLQALEEKMREKMREQMAGVQRDQAARDRQQELRQQMLEAAQAGDEEKVEALRKQMDEGGMAAARRKMLAEHYDEVEKILTLEQKRQFAAWRKLQDSGVPAFLLSNPEALKTALNRVETLSGIQKNQIDAAFARYEKEAETLKPEDVQAKQAKVQELASEVVGVLKPSQKVLLSGAAFQGRQRGEGGRGGPRGQPAPGPNAPATQP